MAETDRDVRRMLPVETEYRIYLSRILSALPDDEEDAECTVASGH